MKVTHNGMIQLVDDKYIDFVSHLHMTTTNLEHLKQDVMAFKELTNDRKLPIISTIHRFDKMDKESENYMREQLPIYFSQMAIVSTNVWVYYLYKLLSKISKFPIPVKIFATRDEALEWIDA